MAARTSYAPSGWLPGPHAMTVYATLVRGGPQAGVVRERWELADGDFLDIDRLAGASAGSPLVLVLHGLEGSTRAGYVRGVLAQASAAGLAGAAFNFRGCSGEPNRLPRFYHSGETGDVAEVVARLVAERPGRPLGIVGFSLGGNVLSKWFGEQGDNLPEEVRAGVAICPPLDLAACAAVLDAGGFWPAVYRSRFLNSLKRKALAKALRFPEAIDADRVRAARSFADFDGDVTAPLHGFSSAADYWARSSAGPELGRVRRPLHILSAADDPFIPSLKVAGSAQVTAEQTKHGGHVAFVQGPPWNTVRWAEARAVAWLGKHLVASR